MSQFLRPVGIDTQYPKYHPAKALQAQGSSAGNAQAVLRAQGRVDRWRAVLVGMFDGSLDIGDRQPIAGMPPWITLEVVTGGFATGRLGYGWCCTAA